MTRSDIDLLALSIRDLIENGSDEEKQAFLNESYGWSSQTVDGVVEQLRPLIQDWPTEWYRDHNAEMFRWLLTNGVSANVRLGGLDHVLGSMTYIHNPHGLGCSRILEVFLQNGADANAIALGGGVLTNLQYAIREFKNDLAKTMLRYGGDPIKRNEADQTAFDVAKSCRNNDILMLLNGEYRS